MKLSQISLVVWGLLIIVCFASIKKEDAKTIIPVKDRNMPGQPISNFAFINKDGEQRRLSDIQGKPKILLFYAPDNKNSEQAIKEMTDSKVLDTLLHNNALEVVTVSPVGDLKQWKTYEKKLPDSWRNGFDIDGEILKDSLLHVENFPTFYLVDEKDNVILENKDLNQILSHAAYYNK